MRYLSLYENYGKEVGTQAKTIQIPVPRGGEIEAMVNAFSSGDLGYHGGSLINKSDYLTDYYRGDLPYTGYYFFSNPEDALSRGNRSTSESEFSVVDFSKYNLYKPSTSEYWTVFYALKSIETFLLKGKDIEYIFDSSRVNQIIQFRGIGELIFTNKDNIVKWFTDWKASSKINLGGVGAKERFETFFMKKLGYEGVDVRNLKESRYGDASPDTAQFGSVIFDLKPNTVKRFKAI